MKNNIIVALTIGLLISITLISDMRTQMTLSDIKRDVLREYLVKEVKEHRRDKKRLKIYFQIALRQNNIIDQNRSSRNLKLADSELMELMFKLD